MDTGLFIMIFSLAIFILVRTNIILKEIDELSDKLDEILAKLEKGEATNDR